jgi:hypothetical protein
MKKTLSETYYRLIKHANEKLVTEFIFKYGKNYYLVEWWRGRRWSDCRKVELLKEVVK